MFSLEPNALLITIATLLYLLGLILFVRNGNLKEKREKAIIAQLKEANPDCEITDKRKFTLDHTCFEIDSQDKTNSIVSLCLYAGLFFVLPSAISLILVQIYLKINNIEYDVIRAGSAIYNEAVYNQMANSLNILIQAIVYIPSAIAFVIIFRKDIMNAIKSFTKKNVGDGFLGLAFIYAGSLAGGIIISLLGVSGDSSNEEAISSMFKSGAFSAILMGLITVIVAPIVEELIFRKSMFNICKNNNRLALVLSSVVFGGIHIISPAIEALEAIALGTGTYLDFALEIVYIIPYSLMGLALGLTYIRSNRNIVAVMMAHALNNLLSTLVTLLMK